MMSPTSSDVELMAMRSADVTGFTVVGVRSHLVAVEAFVGRGLVADADRPGGGPAPHGEPVV
jgi:hypothetical protein